MSGMDIGIDLGTSTIIIYLRNKGIVLSEPSVIAVDKRKDEVLAVGSRALEMIGKTPGYITAERPLKDGVISNHVLTEYMIREYVRQVCGPLLVKPRISICVPSSVTKLEADAVVSAALSAGARKVYLVEEPIAAAIGCGIDISKPNGIMIVDVGGGTTNVAVISLSGIVSSLAVRYGGQSFDELIADYVRTRHKVLIGERMAENIKLEIADVFQSAPDVSMEVRGRSLTTGLPVKFDLTQEELFPVVHEHALTIIDGVREILENTPPELAGDIHSNGITMVGGGSLMKGFAQLLSSEVGIETIIADDPLNCVAIGAGKSFDYLEDLNQGFSDGLAAER